MKALVLDRPGSMDYMRVADIAIPEPAEGAVRVKVHAAGLNPVDYKLLRGGHPAWHYPFVLGLDVAGTIDALGAGVEGWYVGDRVYYHGDLSRPGGYAEYAVIPSHVIAPLPDALSFMDAAALPCAGFTAYQAIFRKLRLQHGQTILVQGGSGGVGGFGVQFAASVGAVVLTTTTEPNATYVQDLGAHHIIDYQKENVHARVMELTGGRGVDAILDTVGPTTATEGLDMLAFFGSIVYIVEGLLDFSRVRFERATSLHGLSLGGAYPSGDRIAQEDLARMGRELGVLVSQGTISPMLSETIALEEIPGALARLEQRHVRGKIVAQIG